MPGVYFKTSKRNLWRTKGFTILNILGLSLGLAAFLLISFYIFDELSFDRFHTKSDRIFRVNSDVKFSGSLSAFATTGPGLSALIKNNFPEVEKTVRLFPGGMFIRKGNEKIKEDRIAYADPEIFEIFTFPMIYGDPKTALSSPNSIVITESIAKKYFSITDVVGHTLTMLDGDSVIYKKITGVIRDIPKQSQLNFDLFFSMSSLSSGRDNNLSTLNFYTYILLKPHTDYKNLERKFPSFLRKSLSNQGWDMDAFEKGGSSMKINLSPLTEIHLQPRRLGETGTNGNRQYLTIFSVTAVFILILACINFMNLSTARSSNRAREVGVRKVLGSSRWDLIQLFLSESLLLTLFSTVISCMLAGLLLPLFNRLSDKELEVTWGMIKWLIPFFVVVIVGVGILAGLYPAFILSAFQPVDTLKGNIVSGFKTSRIRNFLVVFQFSISIILLFGTLVIYGQLKFIQETNIGFNRNQVLVIRNFDLVKDPVLFKNQATQLPGVLNSTISSFLPTDTRAWPNFISNGKEGIPTQFWPVDKDYLSTLDIRLVKGRNFSSRFLTDSSAILINESASKMLGFGDDPLNKSLYFQNKKVYHVIGMVRNFNFSSLKDPVSALVMPMSTPFELTMEGDSGDKLCLRVNPAALPRLLFELKHQWNTVSTGQPFEYSFMDEDFNALYKTEQRTEIISLLFTSLAIVIACLGLFALASYSAENRNREFSIRKVLGANTRIIAAMLSKDFLRLILIANGIGIPIAWILMYYWLEDFANRAVIPWWIGFSVSLTVLFIAAATILYQTIKAAHANPVQGLRSNS